MKNMIAIFHSVEERDRVVSDAKSAGNIEILFVGNVNPVIDGNPASGPPDPFILFRAYSAMDMIFFMQHGAGSCSDV